MIHLQLAVIPIEIIPLFLIYFDSSYWIMATIAIALVAQIAVQFIIIRKMNQLAHYDKLKIKIDDETISASTILP